MLLFLHGCVHVCRGFCKLDYEKWGFFALRVRAFLLLNYAPKGLHRFAHVRAVYGKKILSRSSTLAKAIGKILFNIFSLLIVTKLNVFSCTNFPDFPDYAYFSFIFFLTDL